MAEWKKEFLLKVFAPDEVLFEGDVAMVTLPGIQGEFSVLPRHSSFMSVLKEGVMKIHKDVNEKVIEISIEGGCAQIDSSSNDVVILIS